MKIKGPAFLLTVFFMFLCFFSSVSAEETKSGNAEIDSSDRFVSFCENAAGRYGLSSDYDTAVLELVPAFGRLFASVAYYMDGGSLYSYYASELAPACMIRSDLCGTDTELSFVLDIRSFSNMSYAGEYWPGETYQRLTLNDQGIALSDFEGDGDPLLTADDSQLIRDPSAPSVFIYAPGGGSVPDKFGFEFMVPEYLEGSWRSGAGDETVFVSFGADKRIMLLSDPAGSPSVSPSELYIGTYSLLKTQPDSFVMCYIMSRPDSGGMPYEGCAMLQTGGRDLAVNRIDGYDCLLIPDSGETMVYSR